MNIRLRYINLWRDETVFCLKKYIEYGFIKMGYNIIEDNCCEFPDVVVTSVMGNPASLRQFDTKRTFIIVYTGENTESSIWNPWKYENIVSKYEIGAYLGFDRDEGPRKFRVPLWVIYHQLQNETSYAKKLVQSNHVVNDFKPICNRSTSVTLISNHGGNFRQEFYNKCTNSNIVVKCPGKFKHNDSHLKDIEKRAIGWSKRRDAKVEYLSHYVFNLCPENSNTNGYCTEKIMDCVIAGCIPIYWGDDEHGKIFNQDRIIKVDNSKPNSLDDAIMTIKSMLDNKEYLNKFFEQPVFSKDAIVYIDEFVNKIVLVAKLYTEFVTRKTSIVMNTIFDNELKGWTDFNENQLLRCKHQKIYEGKLLLNIPHGASFLDIGANYGDTVCTMAAYAKSKNRSDIRFYAFEPNIEKIKHIEKISTLNNLNIIVYNTCVGFDRTNAIFDGIVNEKSGAASFKLDTNGPYNIIRLDDIKSELEPIGYMHIDTEGWDCAVLKGSREILLNDENSPMYIVVECWTDHVAKEQVDKGRAKGVATNTPAKDIMYEMHSYNDIKFIHKLKDHDINLIFKKG